MWSFLFDVAGKCPAQPLHEVCGPCRLLHHLPVPAVVQRIGPLRGHPHHAKRDRHWPPHADLPGQDHRIQLDRDAHHGLGHRWDRIYLFNILWYCAGLHCTRGAWKCVVRGKGMNQSHVSGARKDSIKFQRRTTSVIKQWSSTMAKSLSIQGGLYCYRP